jgi:CARDB
MRARQLFLFASVLLTITHAGALSLPDLVETLVSSPPSTAVVGGSFSVKDTAKNLGSVSAGASTTRYYFSLDKLKSSGDKLLSGQRGVPILAPGQSSSATVSATIPSGTAAGTYFLLACADDTKIVAEGNETNNCLASGTAVQIKGPDLRETSVSNPPSAVKIGGSFSVTDVAKNQGLTSAGASVTRYYLSTDRLKSSGDTLLSGSRSVATLLAGQSSTGTVSVTIPSGAAAGIYFLLACADDTKLVSETNETNNCIASTNTVTAGPNFSLSLSPSTTSLKVSRGNSGIVQVSVTALNGFAGTVTITLKNLPTGVTSAPINVAAGSSGTLTLNVSSATATGPFTISLVGTSGTLSHSTPVSLTVPFGGGVLTIVPTTSGSFAIPVNVVAYLSALEADVAPVRLQECGSESSTLAFGMQNDPSDSTSTHTDNNNHYINLQSLPTVPANGAKDYTDYSVYETAHALQFDLLHNATHRATQADIEGFSQTCSDLVYRVLALSGKGTAPKTGGDTNMLSMDTLRAVDPEAITAASWIQTSAAYFQPVMSIGEGSFLLSRSRTGANGLNGLVEHENAIFAAEFATYTGQPLTPTDRIRVWDSTGLMFDGQSAGQWMSPAMIQDSVFIVGKPHLVAWPVYPQFPAQMMAQAFLVTGVTPSINPTEPGGIPTVQAVSSGPLTITVRDATTQHNAVLGPIQADFSQTTGIANYNLNLQTQAPQGTYTVYVNATVNGTALQQSFVVANIPFAKTGLGGTDLMFPGQYLVAVDGQGHANNGSLTVTRGSVVWSMTGFAIVQPDSTGTFDVTGPSGTKHTYTAPGKWARFIPVE